MIDWPRDIDGNELQAAEVGRMENRTSNQRVLDAVADLECWAQSVLNPSISLGAARRICRLLEEQEAEIQRLRAALDRYAASATGVSVKYPRAADEPSEQPEAPWDPPDNP